MLPIYLPLPPPRGQGHVPEESWHPGGPVGAEHVGWGYSQMDAGHGASPSLLWCLVTLGEDPGLPLVRCVTLGQLLNL